MSEESNVLEKPRWAPKAVPGCVRCVTAVSLEPLSHGTGLRYAISDSSVAKICAPLDNLRIPREAGQAERLREPPTLTRGPIYSA